MGVCFGKLDADKEFEKHYNEELHRRLGKQISQGPLYAPPQASRGSRTATRPVFLDGSSGVPDR